MNIEMIIIAILVQGLIVALAIALGRSLVLYKLRKEENRKREFELAILEKRNQIISNGKHIVDNLEEVLYKTKVQQEIDNITRKNGAQ
jgi:hypothetical protein